MTIRPPRVSVLMAAYNAAHHLAEAAQSVLAQTMADLELIIIDDGSVDDTPHIAAGLAESDERVVVARQNNGGIAAAMNAALSLARSDYVAILDSDDVMEPGRLAIQAAHLDGNPTIAALGSQWLTIDMAGRVVGIDRQPTDAETTRRLMFAYFSLHHPTVMARRKILLECGGYPNEQLLGAPDYALFANLATAGHQLVNLPLLLTRWRLNPNGVTHGHAKAQTEDVVAIRDTAFSRLVSRVPDEASAVARELMRSFPEGTWFDKKVNRLLPNPAPSPSLKLWREMASRGEVPSIDAVAVDWLHDEAAYADSLAEELIQADLPWLASLVEAKAGGLPPSPVTAPTVLVPLTDPSCKLSVLIPTRHDDPDLLDRVDATLASLPADGEILVFTTDGSSLPTTLPTFSLIRKVLTTDTANPWQAAVKATTGRYVAWLEAGQRHHHRFLEDGITLLEARPNDALAFAPADIYFADALDAEGNPVRDPAAEPRWSQETLLGRDRAFLGCMLHRRDALFNVPLHLGETGMVSGWSLGRYLLTRYKPIVLDVRNSVTLPAQTLGNNIIPAVSRCLIAWYLDFGLGQIPSQDTWSSINPADAAQRLRDVGEMLLADSQAVHPGNVEQLLNFACRFAPLPVTDPVFRKILFKNRRIALDTLRQKRPIQALIALIYWAATRFSHKLVRSAHAEQAQESQAA